ncbi:MAG TPA: GDSL-type esterase/lipase family protein [Caulobacteraceae bacterium]
MAEPVQTVGIVDDPCAVLPPMPPAIAAFEAALRKAVEEHRPLPTPTPDLPAAAERWMRERQPLDYPNLCKYAAANAALPPPTSDRIVFLGDSITEFWSVMDPTLFDGDRVNRGISGQTTVQMLGRFRADVIALKPRTLHLLGGVNDIAGNTGPTTLACILDNVMSMVELALAHDIRVVLGAATPATRFHWRPDLMAQPHIRHLNDGFRAFAAKAGIVFADYYEVLADAEGGMRDGASDDGVHPNRTGYSIIRPVVERSLADA